MLWGRGTVEGVGARTAALGQRGGKAHEVGFVVNVHNIRVVRTLEGVLENGNLGQHNELAKRVCAELELAADRVFVQRV